VEKGKLYRAGHLPPQRLARKIRKFGIKTIIHVRDEHGTADTPRKKAFGDHNLEYLSLPWPTTTLPRADNLKALLNAFAYKEQPILLYSARKISLTDGPAALWRAVVQNQSKHFARRAFRFGNHSGHRALLGIMPDTDRVHWLRTSYNPAAYPQHNVVSSPRMWPGPNFHAVEKGKLYRSAQLKPQELKHFIQTRGIKTIINLMGPAPGAAWYEMEHATAKEYGATVHDLQWYIDHLPLKENLRRLLELYDTAPQPILIHCREGADRTGECAAIWRLHKQNYSIHGALEQLRLKYRHFAFAHPSKRFFIRQWQGSNWARYTYDPETVGRYVRKPAHSSGPL
ncbi:MAG: tyrosine-protein phosphatase, partial [Candidatus Dependentiae bacterium]